MLPSDEGRLREIVGLSFSRFMGFFAANSLFSDEGQVLVSETQGNVVGFTKLIQFQVGGDKFGCVLWIAVHPKFRRKGVANALINEGMQHLKEDGAKAVFASTQRRNIGAQNVLRRKGFRKMGFVDLWRIFKGRVFEFYSDIWLAPGEIVLMHD
jgi:ribosomal protein S18 acetylase RimI-like enzyme